jgi:hypothetical protein
MRARLVDRIMYGMLPIGQFTIFLRAAPQDASQSDKYFYAVDTFADNVVAQTKLYLRLSAKRHSRR